MQSIRGVDNLWMCGVRASFTLDEGVAFDERTFVDAFAAHGMQLDTFAKHHVPRPETMRRYLVHSGLG